MPPITNRLVIQWTLLALVAVSWSVRPRALPASALYATTSKASPDTSPSPLSVAQQPELPGTLTADLGTGEQDVPQVNWSVLRTLQFRSGTMSDTLRKLNGKRVRVPGFIVPLDDFQETAKEFLLVPYFGACVHEPPPPPNQMVYVAMNSGSARFTMWEPVWIEGTLSVSKYQSIYGAAGFRMKAERVLPYRRPGE
jgi:hypothetical protein